MTTTIETTVAITRSHRRTARQAEQLGSRIVSACRDLIDPSDVLVADPEDVPAGKPLVSLLLHRLSVEAHAYRLEATVDDLVCQLRQEARCRRGESRSTLVEIADRIATLS